jgi:hypothetical protein
MPIPQSRPTCCRPRHPDSQSERAIRVALEQFAEPRTTLVIAHRLSTIVNGDEILERHVPLAQRMPAIALTGFARPEDRQSGWTRTATLRGTQFALDCLGKSLEDT